MQQIVAELYEIEKKLGEGGGGIVYLGQHIRLKKPIVLKADKRRLNVGQEALRREVDLLKNLSQTYIPQVYDYVEQDGVVYTVMDYIEGESLDRLIARGELPAQAELVQWACQLLEALVYLHERPPHGILHGDIKPANIMRKPDGDICLIDFNIALALGEDGAVKVGFSKGYASPEHYGADYIENNRGAAVNSDSYLKDTKEQAAEKGNETELLGECETQKLPTRMEDGGQDGTVTVSQSCENTKKGKRLLLDARSDIYCLGATLYHLISGQRPETDARNVKPLGSEVCSSAISAILQKAMAPYPQDRYQSAKEMQSAFNNLYRTDMRAVRHRRRIRISAAVLAGIFLSGGACSMVGMKQLEQRQGALALAEYSANALAQGDVTGAVRMALNAIPQKKSIFNAPVTAQAQKALTDALGVYDLSAGFKVVDTVLLPGAPFDFSVSPEGGRAAVVYAYEVAVFDLLKQEKIFVCPVKNSALSDCHFLSESVVVYAGEDGITAYDLDAGKVLWKGEEATILSVSGDLKVVAAVNGTEERAVFYNALNGQKIAERSFDGQCLSIPANDIFADAKNYVFSLNGDGSVLAVSFRNGGLYLLSRNDRAEDLILYEASDYTSFYGGFCGKYFAFTAEKNSEVQFGMVDIDAASYVGSFSSQYKMLLQVGEGGIYLANKGLLVRVEPDTMREVEIAHTEGEQITAFCAGKEYALIAAGNGEYAFYDLGANRISSGNLTQNCDFALFSGEYTLLANRSETSMLLLKYEGHKEALLCSYDARYPHDEARVSADGTRVMLFSNKGFRIYGTEGVWVAEGIFPDEDLIYDQQFRREGQTSYLEVVWYDGTRRCYSAADGTMIGEEKGEEPKKDLYEEFYTKKYRVESQLHGAPKVYDLSSGRLLGTLESDDYLTYVTQVGDCLITEYIAASKSRYGLLLNERLETLAYLPGLCDIIGDDVLIFDCESGNLRQSRLYSIQELIALGEIYIKQ